MIYIRLIMANLKAILYVIIAFVAVVFGWRYKTTLRENGRFKARESLGHKVKDIKAARSKKIEEVRNANKESLIDRLNGMSGW